MKWLKQLLVRLLYIVQSLKSFIALCLSKSIFIYLVLKLLLKLRKEHEYYQTKPNKFKVEFLSRIIISTGPV